MDKHNLDILVVDDQSGVRTLLTTALKDKGYQVLVAVNGEDGVKKLKASKPKLVLMDIKMPVKDGITAFYEMKALVPDQKIIMMSAYGERETIDELKSKGALGFIAKPFDLQYMLKFVDSILRIDDFKTYA